MNQKAKKKAEIKHAPEKHTSVEDYQRPKRKAKIEVREKKLVLLMQEVS